MKNICFFNTTKFWGGGEKFNFEYAQGFKDKGYNVYLITSKDSPLSRKTKSQGLNEFNITIGNLSFLNPFKRIRLIRFFKKQNIDTVIFSSSPDLKLGAIAAKNAGVKNIVYRRGLAAPIKNKLLNRYILSNVVTKIFANSLETKKTILQNLSAYLDADRIGVIYNGLNIETKNITKPKEIESMKSMNKGIVLGNLGRLTPQKGQDLLIKIAHQLKERGHKFTLFIGGSGPFEDKLKTLISEYEIEDQVKLLGFIDNIEGFMNGLDIFVLTSIWEGFGFVLSEAMIMEKPVVAFDITSNPEIVDDNKTGFLVDYPDLNSFVDKIEKLIQDESLRSRFGKAGKQRIIDHFQYKDKLEEIETFLLQ